MSVKLFQTPRLKKKIKIKMGIGNDYLKHHVRIMLINKKIDFYLKNNKKISNKMTDLSREDLSKLTIVKLKEFGKGT